MTSRLAISSLERTWPMQGPQALASTVAPADLNAAIWPSREIVARIWVQHEGRTEQSEEAKNVPRFENILR